MSRKFARKSRSTILCGQKNRRCTTRWKPLVTFKNRKMRLDFSKKTPEKSFKGSGEIKPRWSYEETHGEESHHIMGQTWWRLMTWACTISLPVEPGDQCLFIFNRVDLTADRSSSRNCKCMDFYSLLRLSKMLWNCIVKQIMTLSILQENPRVSEGKVSHLIAVQ